MRVSDHALAEHVHPMVFARLVRDVCLLVAWSVQDALRAQLLYAQANSFFELLSHKTGVTMFCKATLLDSACSKPSSRDRVQVFKDHPLPDEQIMVRKYQRDFANTVAEYQSTLAG